MYQDIWLIDVLVGYHLCGHYHLYNRTLCLFTATPVVNQTPAFIVLYGFEPQSLQTQTALVQGQALYLVIYCITLLTFIVHISQPIR